MMDVMPEPMLYAKLFKSSASNSDPCPIDNLTLYGTRICPAMPYPCNVKVLQVLAAHDHSFIIFIVRCVDMTAAHSQYAGKLVPEGWERRDADHLPAA